MSKLFVNTIAPNSGDTVTISGSLLTTGKLIIGDSGSDTVSFEAEISSSLVPDVNGAYNLGSNTNNWRSASITHVTTQQLKTIQLGYPGNTTNFAYFDIVSAHTLAGRSTLSGGTISSSAHLVPTANNTRDLGTSTKNFKTLFIGGISGSAGSEISASRVYVDNIIEGETIHAKVNLSSSLATIVSGGFTNIQTDNITASIGKITNAQVTNLTASGLIRANGNIVGDTNTSISGIATSSVILSNASHVSSSTIQAATSLTVATTPYKKVTITNGNISASNSITSSVVLANHSLSTPSATITTLNATNSTLGTGSFSVVTSSLIPAVNNEVNLGLSNKKWHTLYVTNITASGNITGSTIEGQSLIGDISVATPKLTLTKGTGASVDSATYSVNGSKVEVRTQLQAQLNDGTFAAFRLHNTSIATDSVVMGAFTGGTVGAITASFISANTIAASTASFRIHNETGGNISDNTGFTASFVVL